VVSANCLHCYAESVTCRDDVTETRMRVTHRPVSYEIMPNSVDGDA